jgi:alkyldihydroxyacetonephosphate synthase
LDSQFCAKNKTLYFTGSRYPIGRNIPLSALKKYVKEKFDINTENFENITSSPIPIKFPQAKIDHEFIDVLKKLKIDHSIEGEDRLIRCHGQTLFDIHSIRTGKFSRIPDVILWPLSHDEVVEIVKIANERNVVLIPFGGGTCVSGAVNCPQNETERSIAVLDTSQMNRLLWLDKENLVACFEAGVVGQDLEKVLSSEGLTMGHEPDSHEFSTLGGWVATRASGMKKNVYGNIEDLVVQVKMVTSKGVLERNICAPRVSCGPDFNQIILGSEGTLGVITEVLIKVRPLPPVKKYGSLVFPDFESGVKCLREIAKKRCQPASIRLIDNEQFALGQALKMDGGFFSMIADELKEFALTKIKGYDLKKLTVATLLFEGDKEENEMKEKQIYEIAGRHSGFAAGAANGEKGYVS